MQIAKQMAGFSPAEAETLRRAIGKKIHELMASLKEQVPGRLRRERRHPVGREPALEGHGVRRRTTPSTRRTLRVTH